MFGIEMEQQMTVCADDNKILQSCDYWTLSSRKLLSMVNLKDANTSASKDLGKVRATNGADASRAIHSQIPKTFAPGGPQLQ
jgi:hypothetical protein